ncbi:hypothetical protein, partial [Acinetobacter baumannii]|uniref:hypothetical protein n=1 Tax=Acinetobacter baumannii TaxID=470 RepID=UPI003AF4B3DE
MDFPLGSLKRISVTEKGRKRETRGNIQNIPFSHKKYMLLAKYHTKKLFTTETKTNGYHTLHYHHSNFTTI